MEIWLEAIADRKSMEKIVVLSGVGKTRFEESDRPRPKKNMIVVLNIGTLV